MESQSKAGDVAGTAAIPEKVKKRKLFGFGKKKEVTQDGTQQEPGVGAPSTASQPLSPNRHPYSASLQAHSPASSQIFERDVLETASIPPSSPAVPQHIISEDRIPPVLEASSLAITNDKLDPDAVEIVTHANHIPAAVSVPASTGGDALPNSNIEETTRRIDEESGPGYGALDATDVRRLSFISFADVVQSDLENPGLTSAPSSHQSPSPGLSPSSHGLGTSPPAAHQLSRELDVTSESGLKSPLASPELAVQTMRQALRKTASGDMTGEKSQPLSATSQDAPAKPWA
ncbi:MAG: hypothetical protein M1814_005360 [Vezdaea aestivalis]|nr:MAG: hypothetical protein M1814_005360 [Vezdaea aestivalis]